MACQVVHQERALIAMLHLGDPHYGLGLRGPAAYRAARARLLPDHGDCRAARHRSGEAAPEDVDQGGGHAVTVAPIVSPRPKVSPRCRPRCGPQCPHPRSPSSICRAGTPRPWSPEPCGVGDDGAEIDVVGHPVGPRRAPLHGRSGPGRPAICGPFAASRVGDPSNRGP